MSHGIYSNFNKLWQFSAVIFILKLVKSSFIELYFFYNSSGHAWFYPWHFNESTIQSRISLYSQHLHFFLCFYIRKDVTIKVKLQASHLKLSVKNQFPCDKLVTALIYEIQ